MFCTTYMSKWDMHMLTRIAVFMPPPNIVWPEAYCFCPLRPCIRPYVYPEILLTRHLAEYLTYFHQTYIIDAPWDRDERFTFWGQKFKGQGLSGMQYAGNSTFSFRSSCGLRHTILDNLAWSYIHLVLCCF